NSSSAPGRAHSGAPCLAASLPRWRRKRPAPSPWCGRRGWLLPNRMPAWCGARKESRRVGGVDRAPATDRPGEVWAGLAVIRAAAEVLNDLAAGLAVEEVTGRGRL